ncbi:hypothetical protein Tco_0894870 [Tanacetum coccineum]|uniref:Uncharacterized protein n=1 Tax=Tanacetum coccineum TaxID=301880 RepID=A0ABQ5CFL2_9ASTR
MEKEKNIENNEVVDKNVIELSELNTIEPKDVIVMKKEVKDGANDEPVRNVEEEITRDVIEELVEMPRTYVQRNPQEEDNKKEDMGGNFVIPCNIGGLKYTDALVDQGSDEDKKKPFILGTPFLTTDKFEIRFDKGTITLKSGKNKISFFKIPESLCRVKEGTENDIDPVAPTTTASRLILEWEERIKIHQEKEIEFNQ